MNYYQHHIGDFNNATRHLSLVERAIYRDLLDMYYDTEKPIDASNLERLARRLQCTAEDQTAALKYVLDEFFTLKDGVYINNRCEREIAEYHGKRKQASDAGKASAKKRAEKKQRNSDGGSSNDDHSNSRSSTDVEGQLNENPTTVEAALNGNLTDVQPTINHKPLTNNHEPITSNQYIYTFDLDYVNANLLKSGRRPVDQKYIDQLQPQFELYYANQPMVDNKALVKFVQWIMRNQDQPQKQQSITKTTAQILAEQRMQLDQQQGQVIDVGEPKKPLLIEEVGRA
ncbi:hypothetical protein GS19_08165 [Acinetobacter idrijaensis]|nr:hypothetical protein GS19_08165 [Acinetobacter idrijaensis]